MIEIHKMPMGFRQMHNFLVDVWRLYQDYADTELTDDDIQSFTQKVEQLRKAYLGYPFSVDVLVALTCEMGRIANIKR